MFIFTDKTFINNLKNNLTTRIKHELKYKADIALEAGPWSVTHYKSPAVSGNPHDYFSEGPYWWPDPQNPSGPYIRRDGQHNPDIFTMHRKAIEEMSDTVLLLSQAGFFLDNQEYINRAVSLIDTWFINDSTRMNPHLEYGQAIRGVCDGRGIGIIETKTLLSVIHAAGFIEEFGVFKEELSHLKEWFAQYLKWMNESKKGIDEKNWYNNHSVWWTTQAIAFSVFTDNTQIFNECIDKFKNDIIENQLNSEGAFEDELHRTRSYTYSLFVLEGAALICEVAYHSKIDLWNYKNTSGKGIASAILYMAPYFANMFLWENEQINLKDCFEESLAFQLAALRLSVPDYENLNELRRKNKYLINNSSNIGSLSLLQGFRNEKR